jgi:hypothetical protein
MGLCFCIGILKFEIGLTLIGGVLAILFTYTAIAMFFSIQYITKNSQFSCSIQPVEARSSESITIQIQADVPHPIIQKLPGIIFRYEVFLSTNDEKHIHIVHPLFHAITSTLLPHKDVHPEVHPRGAYYGKQDYLAIYDCSGLFRYTIPLPIYDQARLIVFPEPAPFYPVSEHHAGGVVTREDKTYTRTEDLIEHRSYTPGDDFRRINWKLFGHSGDLFIRQGELEPPPQAEFSIILDCSVDTELFSQEAAQQAIDILAEQALGLTIALQEHRLSTVVGYTGSALQEVTAHTAPRVFAFPFAVPLDSSLDIPTPSSSGQQTLILAVPRTQFGSTALDRYIERTHHHFTVQFICPTRDSIPIAEQCVGYYSQYAGRIDVSYYSS